MGMNILALNSGSSSLKFGLYRVEAARTERLLAETIPTSNQREAFIRVGRLLAESDVPAPAAIGHRIVHGGPKLRQHCLIDDTVLRQLEAAAAFAPLHTPAALSVIRFAQEHFPGLPQAACNGASVTAVKGGKSIDTSMGLTPSGGVILGTRSGDLDPGVLVYLMREKRFDAAMLEELVDHRSGLLGISGVGSDMRRLHEAAPANPDARLAIEMFCCSVRKQIAGMIAALEGVDMLVFTGGIGENDAEVRAAICAGLSWIGVSLDEARNRSASNPISDGASRCSVQVLASQEDEQIARHTWALVA